MPAFKYPYKTTGPISPVIEKFKDIKRKKKRRRKVKENFDTGNVNNEKCALVVIGMAAAIIVITMVAK